KGAQGDLHPDNDFEAIGEPMDEALVQEMFGYLGVTMEGASYPKGQAKLAAKTGTKVAKEELLYTDIGNAAQFVADHGHHIRWFAACKQWLVYDGRRWKPDERESALEYAKQTIAQMMERAINNKDLWKWAHYSSDSRSLNAMINLAKPDLAITAAELDRERFL